MPVFNEQENVMNNSPNGGGASGRFCCVQPVDNFDWGVGPGEEKRADRHMRSVVGDSESARGEKRTV